MDSYSVSCIFNLIFNVIQGARFLYLVFDVKNQGQAMHGILIQDCWYLYQNTLMILLCQTRTILCKILSVIIRASAPTVSILFKDESYQKQ